MYSTPLTLEEYEKYLECFNWEVYFSRDKYDPFVEEINRHMIEISQKNGEVWMKKYLEMYNKYSNLYKKVIKK